ncbi:putative colanic acid biosynthesis glycosyl transferase WcaE [Cyanobium sp. PCC 7001]|nr:putative colanic acid biosynthesis glycosyl transferase WcaE [Cyanobium sp. PCC 7001]
MDPWIETIKENLRLCCDNNLELEVIFVYTAKVIDASLPSLQEITAKFAQYPGQIRVLPCLQPGIYAAMNSGISSSRGNYLLFLGADDRLLPGFLTAMSLLQQLRSSPCVLADARLPANTEQDLQAIRRSGGRAGQVHWLLGMPRIHQAIFYQRSYLIKHHLRYATDLRVCSDYLLTCEILSNTKGKSSAIDACIVVYNDAGFSSRHKTRQLYCEHVSGFWQSQHLRIYTPLVIATRLLLLAFKAILNSFFGTSSQSSSRISS